MPLWHCLFFINAGDQIISHTVSRAVPSAQRGLTSVFGMGTGDPSQYGHRQTEAFRGIEPQAEVLSAWREGSLGSPLNPDSAWRDGLPAASRTSRTSRIVSLGPIQGTRRQSSATRTC